MSIIQLLCNSVVRFLIPSLIEVLETAFGQLSNKFMMTQNILKLLIHMDYLGGAICAYV